MAASVKNIYDIPVTYSGLLDDVMLRHAIMPEVDGDFFTRAIVRNVFFSGRIALNDGYLVNHPSAVEQLTREGSVLREMIKNDFIVVLSRKADPESFASNPEAMAKEGVKTFQQLVSRSDWPEVKRRLLHLAEGWFAYNKVEMWPKFQMHEGFRRLFERIFDTTVEDLGVTALTDMQLDSIRSKILEQESWEKAPRTAVENVVVNMRDARQIPNLAVQELMNIANQCYHYNFAMCLSADRKKTYVTDTTIGSAFDDILHFDDAIEAELRDVPALAIPKKFPIGNGLLFSALLEPGSELSRAKHAFLHEINEVFQQRTQRGADESVKILREASDAYRNKLAEHFSDFIGPADLAPTRTSLITFGFGKLGSAVGADNAILAANLAARGKVSSFIHKLTKPIRRRILNVALNPEAGELKEMTFRVGEIRPRFASLAFDQKAITKHAKAVPAFNK